MAQWVLADVLVNAPEQAEQLRVDQRGNLYWSDRYKSWTKGVFTGQYSANQADTVIASKTVKS